MLNDQNRVALFHQSIQAIQQKSDVMEMKTGGRLIKQVEGFSSRFFSEFRGKFDPLRLSS